MSKSQKIRQQKHAFRFQIEDEGEKPRIITAWAKVKWATAPVTLTLTAADVRRALQLNGVGNTGKCAMAICAKRQRSSFPHPVEGYIGWTYRTAHVVTRVSRVTGMPTHCVGYHHQDNVAPLFDNVAGQKKLLVDLEKNGPREIRLHPYIRKKQHARPERPTTGHGVTGERQHVKQAGRGTKLRFAKMLEGAVAA